MAALGEAAHGQFGDIPPPFPLTLTLSPVEREQLASRVPNPTRTPLIPRGAFSIASEFVLFILGPKDVVLVLQILRFHPGDEFLGEIVQFNRLDADIVDQP